MINLSLDKFAVFQVTLVMFSNELPIGSKGFCLRKYCYFPVMRLVKFVYVALARV